MKGLKTVCTQTHTGWETSRATKLTLLRWWRCGGATGTTEALWWRSTSTLGWTGPLCEGAAWAYAALLWDGGQLRAYGTWSEDRPVRVTLQWEFVADHLIRVRKWTWGSLCIAGHSSYGTTSWDLLEGQKAEHKQSRLVEGIRNNFLVQVLHGPPRGDAHVDVLFTTKDKLEI